MVNFTVPPLHLQFYDYDDENGRYPRMSRKEQLHRWDTLHGMVWVPCDSARNVPPSAVECDSASGKRKKLYLGRAEHAGSITPGFIDPVKKICTIPWGGKAHEKKMYDFLCTPGKFVPCDDTNTLLRATPAGVSEQGEPLYLGRVEVNGRLICGKVQRSHAVCYVPHNSKEKAWQSFEIFLKS
ncbi:uncharacterized protein LOC118509888 isoform X2 [Anopheles stephensi]|uniref:uncharacterized protein LOC118509888 isoform X2 n=1 Tax=Anopheles stephensi TaxID=30069 RepID=UPI0016588A4C|nr:uncharacterized protein LOC118509888 isoform X2 [Anopheles stephensi]